MFKVDLDQLRKCKCRLEAEAIRLRQAVDELEAVAHELKHNTYLEDMWLLLVREIEGLRIRLKQIGEYADALGNVIYIYENEEYAIIRNCLSVPDRFKVSHTILRDFRYLDELLAGINIQ